MQLVGMLILAYVSRSHLPFLSEVSTDSVGTGLLGIMGNKGGVGIRFKLYDSYFTFINSHLAAEKNQVARRNLDFEEICKRMEFRLDGDPPSNANPSGKAANGAREDGSTYLQYKLAHPWVCTYSDTGLQYWAGSEQTALPMNARRTCTPFDTEYANHFILR
jgi:hypothetical protein